MKLSVCIPVYNFDVRELIFDLKKEITKKGIDSEIILIDDASYQKFKEINNELQSEVKELIFLEKNIGRSKIRNLFLQYAEGDYLLFLDCDGKIISPDFLETYIETIQQNSKIDVLYGGRTVANVLTDKRHVLRWKFAVERENLSVSRRNGRPYLSFQTNNFIIKKQILSTVQFNPELENYGYEDLLFAMDLKSERIYIHHINNAIFNNDLEANSIYLKKVEESVDNLARMLKSDSLKAKISDIKLVKAYHFIQKWNLKFIFLLLFSFIENILKRNLLSDDPHLRNLDFYKLGLLLRKLK